MLTKRQRYAMHVAVGSVAFVHAHWAGLDADRLTHLARCRDCREWVAAEVSRAVVEYDRWMRNN